MKDSKTIITQHLLSTLFIQVIFVLSIALPQLEPLRTAAEQNLRLPAGTMWIVLFAILFVCTAILLGRLYKRISTPLSQLVEQTKVGTASFAFKTKSMVAEEDFLKHYIEGKALKFAEIEQEILNMQEEIEKVEAISKISPEEHQALSTKIAKIEGEAKELQEQLAEEQQTNAKLTSNLNTTEKALSKTSRVLEQNRLEQNAPTPEPPNQAPITEHLPRITTTLSLIANLSWRLAKSWAESSPADMRDGFQEINRHSQEQLDALKK